MWLELDDSGECRLTLGSRLGFRAACRLIMGLGLAGALLTWANLRRAQQTVLLIPSGARAPLGRPSSAIWAHSVRRLGAACLAPAPIRAASQPK